MIAELSKSSKPNKRFKVVIDGKKTIHFGAKGGSTFIDHKDTEKKSNWIARHKVRENWNNKKSAGFWAKHILWNKTSLRESIKDTEKKFNIDIKYK